MTKRLVTDEQFERAFLQRSTVYARHVRERSAPERIGSLDAFNPIFVTVSGTPLVRENYDFRTT